MKEKEIGECNKLNKHIDLLNFISNMKMNKRKRNR